MRKTPQAHPTRPLLFVDSSANSTFRRMLRRRRDRRSVSPKRNQKYSGDDGRTRGSSVEGRRTKTTSSLSHKSGTSPPPPTARRMLFGRNKNKPKQDHSPPPPSLIHRNHASPKISLKPKPRMQSPMAMYTSSPSVRTNSSSSRSRLVDDKFNSSLGLLYHSEDDDDDSFGHNNDSDEFSQEIQSVSSMGDAAKDDNDFLDSPSSIKQKESLDAVSDIEKLAQSKYCICLTVDMLIFFHFLKFNLMVLPCILFLQNLERIRPTNAFALCRITPTQI